MLIAYLHPSGREVKKFLWSLALIWLHVHPLFEMIDGKKQEGEKNNVKKSKEWTEKLCKSRAKKQHPAITHAWYFTVQNRTVRVEIEAKLMSYHFVSTNEWSLVQPRGVKLAITDLSSEFINRYYSSTLQQWCRLVYCVTALPCRCLVAQEWGGG